MNKMRVNKNYLILFFVISLFLIFFILVLHTLTSTIPSPSTPDAQEPKDTYRTPSGGEVFYDPEYFTEEEIKEIYKKEDENAHE